MTASIQVSRVPQYTLCRGYRWVGGRRMATLSQKISHFHKREIKNLLGQLQRKHRTVLWQSVMSAVSNENHKTSAHPLEQTHSARELSSREQTSDTPQDAQHVRGTSWWGGVNIWRKHIHWQMASSAVKCIGSILDVIIPSNTYMSQSLSATLRIQYVL